MRRAAIALVALACVGASGCRQLYPGELGDRDAGTFELHRPCWQCPQTRNVIVGSSARLSVGLWECPSPIEVGISGSSLRLEPIEGSPFDEGCRASFLLHADAPGSGTLLLNPAATDGPTDTYGVGAVEAATLSIARASYMTEWSTRVDEERITIRAGGSVSLMPHAFGVGGELLIPPVTGVAWSTSDASIIGAPVALDASAFASATARAPGRATLTARFRELSASVVIEVIEGE